MVTAAADATAGQPIPPSSLVADMPPAIHAALGLSPTTAAASAAAAASSAGAAVDDVVVGAKAGDGPPTKGSSSSSVIDLCGEDSDDDDDSSSLEAAAAAAKAKAGTGGGRRYSLEANDGSEASSRSSSSRSSSSRSSSRTRRSASFGARRQQQQQQQAKEPGQEQEEYGRGKRRVKPVTVRIGKDHVKIANAYSVVGERYIYEDVSGAAVATRPKAKPLPAKKPAAKKPPKAPTPAQAQLKARNAAVDAMKAEAQGRRQQFFRRHLEAIRPFVSPAVAARLEAVPLPASAAAAKAAKAAKAQQQPEVVEGGEMRDYQLLGLQFMLAQHAQGVPIILGDEMGLGKTLQSLAFLAHLHLERGLKGPSLVVCPLSVLASWMNEARRWVPQLKVLQFHTSDLEERKRQCREVLPGGDYDVVVTTYEMVKNDVCRHYLVRMCHWSYLVLDEGHVVKSPETELAQTVRRMHLGNVLLLTGTPLQNNLRELWALLNFMAPEVFDEDSEAIFARSFDIKEKRVDPGMLTKAHALLKPLMLRRLKVDVERGLPPRIETKVCCHLSEMQRFWYKRLLLKDADVVARLANSGGDSSAIAAALTTTDDSDAAAAAATGGEEGEEGGKPKSTAADWRRLQMLMCQLRKCCNHPYLFWGAEPNPEETNVEEMIAASGKLQTLDRLLQRLHARGHRVAIFSQWKHSLDIIDDYMYHRGYRYTRLDGGTNRVRRQINIETFNAPDSPLFAFLMTTRAGGLGINLQTADTVILYDSDWNPQADAQAMARVHRIGQTKVVHVYRLMTRGTIEERIMEKAEKKQFLSEHVNRDSLVEARAGGEAAAAGGGGGSGSRFGFGVEEVGEEDVGEGLLSHLRFGADAVAAADGANEPLDDATLDAIVDRTRTGSEVAALSTLKADKKDAATFDAGKEETSTRALQGEVYERPKQQYTGLGDISQEWTDLVAGQKRKRQNRVEMMEGAGTGYGGAVPILRENNYDLEAGEASVFQRELKGRSDPSAFRDVKRTKLTAGWDFDYDDLCQCCLDGGELVCCEYCPSTYHPGCLGVRSANELPNRWRCPQHNCFECGKGPTAAGGVIFRCVCCAFSCCYDHKPAEAAIVASNARHEALGYPPMQHTCYIHCSADCQEYARVHLPQMGPPVGARYPMEA